MAYQAERNRKIYEARQAGETLASIAARYNLCTQRVADICNKEKRREQARRLKRRYGTLSSIKELERIDYDLERLARRRRLQMRDEDAQLAESVNELRQKVQNLIEVYGEEG